MKINLMSYLVYDSLTSRKTFFFSFCPSRCLICMFRTCGVYCLTFDFDTLYYWMDFWFEKNFSMFLQTNKRADKL